MISFIIIGRNEGWKLSKCISGVFETINYNELSKFEVIYVDSNSSDESVKIAKENKLIKVYKIIGDINAAVARNVGVEKSSGDVFFFVDGDMEIQPEFLSFVYSEKNGLIHDFVSGNWMNYYYDYSDKFLRKEKYIEMKEDHYEKVTGGFFLINRNAWNLVGGMNNKFKKGQDIDLGLQLAKKRIFLLRKKEIGVIHHTISYFDKKRMWQDLFSMNHLYHRSYLYRNHMLNKHMYHRLFRMDYTLLILIFSILSFLFFPDLGVIFISIYFIALIIRGKLSPENIVFLFVSDVTVLFGLIFFIPKKNSFSIEKMN